MGYVIGSGWWSAGSDDHDERKKLYGDAEIRSSPFALLWHESISRYSNPDKILIVDSNSPVKPPQIHDNRREIVSLPFNAGHSSNHSGKYAGWTRSVLVGLSYALASDSDYFVYVEQDCLLAGSGIVEAAISAMSSPFMFGSGVGTPQPLQQSFFVVRQDGYVRFLHRLQSIRQRDRELSPEWKFAVASGGIPAWMAAGLQRSVRLRALARRALLKSGSFDTLPYGYGRVRPIDWSDEHFYFQWGSGDELAQYRVRLNLH